MFDSIFDGVSLDGTMNDIDNWWTDHVQNTWTDAVGGGGGDVTEDPGTPPPGDEGGGPGSPMGPSPNFGDPNPGETGPPAPGTENNPTNSPTPGNTSTDNGNTGKGFASGLTKAAINSGLQALQKGTGAASNQAASRAAVDRAPTIQNLTGNTGRTRDGYMNITDPVHSKVLESVNPTTYYRYFATFMRGFAASETPA